MGAGFAKVTLIGNLGKDPEVRQTGGGTAVCNLRVACTGKAKGKDGTWADQTEWVALVCFGKTAENVGKFLKKGSQIHAEGRLQTREWTDKEGTKKFSTEVVANEILFIGGKKDGAKSATAESGDDGTTETDAQDPMTHDTPF